MLRTLCQNKPQIIQGNGICRYQAWCGFWGNPWMLLQKLLHYLYQSQDVAPADLTVSADSSSYWQLFVHDNEWWPRLGLSINSQYVRIALTHPALTSRLCFHRSILPHQEAGYTAIYTSVLTLTPEEINSETYWSTPAPRWPYDFKSECWPTSSLDNTPPTICFRVANHP